MKRKEEGSTLRRIRREIGKEALRQIRGFPKEFRKQVAGGWGDELAYQIFGIPARNRHRRRRS